jgi:hypothetical protein
MVFVTLLLTPVPCRDITKNRKCVTVKKQKQRYKTGGENDEFNGVTGRAVPAIVRKTD